MKEVIIYLVVMAIAIYVGAWTIGYLVDKSRNASCVCGTTTEITNMLKDCSYE